MKKTFVILALTSLSLQCVDFYPTKETLRRVFNHIVHKEKGAYFSFADEDIQYATSPNTIYHTEIVETFALNQPNIYKALPYHCKGVGIGKKIPLDQIDACCNTTMEKIGPIIGGTKVDLFKPQLFAHEPLAVLAQYDHDMHYCVRFIWALKTKISIFISQKELPDELKKCLFGSKCSYAAITNFSSLNDLEQHCKAIIPDAFSVIAYEGSTEARILAKRILKSNKNVFLFDLGNFIEILKDEKKEYNINTSKLKNMLSRDIKIFYGAALLHNNQFEHRKNEYMACLNNLHSHWYIPYIAEAIRNYPTFLDQGSVGVCYTLVNNDRLRNKGANEARSLLKAYNHFNFDDESMIVKLTGRYLFKTDSFLQLIESTDYDAFATFDPRCIYTTGAAYGIKGKYFKEMLQSLNPNEMEAQMIDIERLVLNYLKKIEAEYSAKVLYIDDMDIKCFVAHSYHYEF